MSPCTSCFGGQEEHREHLQCTGQQPFLPLLACHLSDPNRASDDDEVSFSCLICNICILRQKDNPPLNATTWSMIRNFSPRHAVWNSWVYPTACWGTYPDNWRTRGFVYIAEYNILFHGSSFTARAHRWESWALHDNHSWTAAKPDGLNSCRSSTSIYGYITNAVEKAAKTREKEAAGVGFIFALLWLDISLVTLLLLTWTCRSGQNQYIYFTSLITRAFTCPTLD